MEFAALLKDGHTAVIPPWGNVRPGHDYPPVELQAIGDRFFVARVGDSEQIRNQKIYTGLEILEIGDGISVNNYLAEKVLRFRSFGTPHASRAIRLVGF